MSIYDQLGLYINGNWIKNTNNNPLTVINPATGKSIGTVPAAGAKETTEAIEIAHNALLKQQELNVWERAELLVKIANKMKSATLEAAELLTLETGKPLDAATREWNMSIDQFIWYAGEAQKVYGRIIPNRVPNTQMEIHHSAVGVVAAFTAWNFPAVLIARKLAPALAAGCTVLTRPSEEAPGIAMLIFRCMHEAGLPSGFANLLLGRASDIYKVVMDSKIVRKVSLTGSTRVGQMMVADSSKTLKKVTMELGGNASAIIDKDADIEQATTALIGSKFSNAGQVCVAADRFYIHKDIYSKFVKSFVEKAKKLKVGNGLEEGTNMGPMISSQSVDRIQERVENAISLGAKLACGGKKPSLANTKGYFFEPTVLTDVPENAEVLKTENFGPIAALRSVDSIDQAIDLANSSHLGLASYCFSKNLANIRKITSKLTVGMVGANSCALATAEAPFGGINYSGWGSEGGLEGIKDYCNIKLVVSAP